MKKIPIGLCVLALCLLTACLDFCGVSHLKGNTKYTYSYTNPDGTTHSDEFMTNEYGQATVDVPPGTDCGAVKIEEKHSEIAMEESAV
jgi:hypothetical protein